jgi:hypothetical protein
MSCPALEWLVAARGVRERRVRGDSPGGPAWYRACAHACRTVAFAAAVLSAVDSFRTWYPTATLRFGFASTTCVAPGRRVPPLRLAPRPLLYYPGCRTGGRGGARGLLVATLCWHASGQPPVSGSRPAVACCRRPAIVVVLTAVSPRGALSRGTVSQLHDRAAVRAARGRWSRRRWG